MKSFAEWAAIGRTVRKGERARYRRVNEDLSQSVALFDEDQTEDYIEVGTDWKVITAAEWADLQAEKTRPKVILDEASGVVTVWCGNNKKAIALLRKNNYWFDMRIHRWCKKGKTKEEVAAGFEYMGYRVEFT